MDDLGIWSSAVAADGRPGSALRFDPRLVADPSARERLVAAVIADRRLAQSGMTGLVPVADLVTGRGRGLADHLGAGRPDGGRPAVVRPARVVPARRGQRGHGPGGGPRRRCWPYTPPALAHGELHPGTVVIAADGSALLAERGLADALLGRPPAPERDVAAWASLARGLAATWASAVPRGRRAAGEGGGGRPPSGASPPRATRCSPGATCCRPGSPPATGWWRPCTGGRSTRRPPWAGIRRPYAPPPTRGDRHAAARPEAG
ncbi:hypothetical protein [Streptosporangium vulgare]|uniref:hypothetical protein n=1 Tax=Streptosporangium vulgare TaxID=46190 RepID=UPI0031DEFD20